MFLHALTLVALATVPSARGPVVLVSPELTPIAASATAATFFSNRLAQELEEAGVRVSTRARIVEALGVESAAALLECDVEAAPCLAQLRGTLGADALLRGELEQTALGYRVHVRVLSASDAQLLAEESVDGFGATELQSRLRVMARSIAQTLSARLGAPLEQRTSNKSRALLPAGAGVVLTGVGAAFLASAALAHNRLTHPYGVVEPTPEVAVQMSRSGQRNQVVGGVLVGAGLAVGGYALYLLLRNEDRPSGAALSFGLTPNSAGIALSGVLP